MEQLRELGVTPHVAQNNRKAEQCNRWPDDEACGLRDKPKEEEAGGRSLRVAEDGGSDEEDEVPGTGAGGLDVHLRGRSLQPGEDAKSGGGGRVRGAGRGEKRLFR